MSKKKRLGQSQKTPGTVTEGQKSLTFAANRGPAVMNSVFHHNVYLKCTFFFFFGKRTERKMGVKIFSTTFLGTISQFYEEFSETLAQNPARY